jgi:signal peptidase II
VGGLANVPAVVAAIVLIRTEDKFVKLITRFLLIVLLALVCVALDQWTKQVAQELLMDTRPIVLWNNALRFHYAENPGAFMSLGAEWSPAMRNLMFVVVNGLTLPLVVVLTVRSPEIGRWQQVAVALIVGGGLGNLVDRFTNNGAVIDFINMGIGPWRTGIFNVADIAVVVGVLLMLVFSARGENQGNSEELALARQVQELGGIQEGVE